jgi:hypothetical protein
MGNQGSNLVSSEPATNHKKRNRQTKTNNQYGIINSRGISRRRNREKIAAYTASKLAKAIGNSLPGGKRVRITAINEAGRKHNGKKEGGGNASDGRGYKGHEGQRQYGALPRSDNQGEDLFFCASLAMGTPRPHSVFLVCSFIPAVLEHRQDHSCRSPCRGAKLDVGSSHCQHLIQPCQTRTRPPKPLGLAQTAIVTRPLFLSLPVCSSARIVAMTYRKLAYIVKDQDPLVLGCP